MRLPKLVLVVILLVAACDGSVDHDGGDARATTSAANGTAATMAATTATSPQPSTTVPSTRAGSVTSSQTQEDALRDHVVPAVATLPFSRRVKTELEVPADEGVWMLTTLSEAVEEESWAAGCGLGDPLGTYPVDIICTVEYGEILLVKNGDIARAYPMPGAVPSWLHVTDGFVYSGRVGDGGLPDSTLVRIDRATLEATVVVIPAEFDGGSEWLPDWRFVRDDHRDHYEIAVTVGPDAVGTAVESTIGTMAVDLAVVDEIIDTATVSSATAEA